MSEEQVRNALDNLDAVTVRFSDLVRRVPGLRDRAAEHLRGWPKGEKVLRITPFGGLTWDRDHGQLTDGQIHTWIDLQAKETREAILDQILIASGAFSRKPPAPQAARRPARRRAARARPPAAG